MEGEFLLALAGLIPFLTGTVLPALGIGALSGLTSREYKNYLKMGISQEGKWCDRN